MKKELTLGISKGSLYNMTIQLFSLLGMAVEQIGRKFEAKIRGIGVFDECLILRPEDIPRAIALGFIDCGLTGWDFVVEKGYENSLIKITELFYSKTTGASAARIAVYGRDEFRDGPEVAVNAEYINLARKVFSQAKIDFSTGTTEAKVAMGMYDFGVGVVETGRSLRDNNLKIVKEIMPSPVVLMAREATPEIIMFGEILQGALQSMKYKLLKLNINIEAKDKVVAILPAIESPTVNTLADGSFAIESVIPIVGDSEAGVPASADLIMRLRELGATGIIMQDINCVV